MLLSREQLKERIAELCKEKNAIIMAHNYELGEIQDIAHFCGDSLELSMKAENVEADVIVFCGVHFMAETAYMLSPEKTVLLPNEKAGCAMADMATADDLRALKAQYDNPYVACYVNSTAAVKAECDICVTSANAVKIMKQAPKDREIIFVPDMNLGRYIEEQTGRKMVLWEGFCPIHHRITPEMVEQRRAEFPEAEVLVHPEAPIEIIHMADHVLSTGGMLRHLNGTDKKQFIIATEGGIIYRMSKEHPQKQFIPLSEQLVCPDMKMIRLEDVMTSLETMTTKIIVDENIRINGVKPIKRMLELS